MEPRAVVPLAGRHRRGAEGTGDLDGERRTAAAGDAGGSGGLPRHDLAWKGGHRPRTEALRVRDPVRAGGGGRGERRLGHRPADEHDVEPPSAHRRRRQPRPRCYGGPRGGAPRGRGALNPSMFDDLDIHNTRERLLVGLADTALAVAALPGRLMRPRPRATPRRVLLLRLERIGDLLMSVGAITEIRRRLPDATIDLVVGSWNEALAQLLPVNAVEVLDAPWLARGTTAGSIGGLLRRAAGWRGRHYDLAINLEGDLRS